MVILQLLNLLHISDYSRLIMGHNGLPMTTTVKSGIGICWSLQSLARSVVRLKNDVIFWSGNFFSIHFFFFFQFHVSTFWQPIFSRNCAWQISKYYYTWYCSTHLVAAALGANIISTIESDFNTRFYDRLGRVIFIMDLKRQEKFQFDI